MRASSLDLRERVLAALDIGTSRATVAATFRVSERTIARWLARRQTGQPLAGGTGPGRPPRIPDDALPTLRAQLQAAPDATFAAYLQTWNAQQPAVSQSALVWAIQWLGWTRKKRRSTLANKTR